MIDVNNAPRYAIVAALAVLLTACASKPLPEADSPAARTYAATCGGCHAVYRPEMYTAGMWRTMVDRMDLAMTRRGHPMSIATKRDILEYLQRNAGER